MIVEFLEKPKIKVYVDEHLAIILSVRSTEYIVSTNTHIKGWEQSIKNHLA